MSADELRALAQRVMDATGPDRALQIGVMAAFGWKPYDGPIAGLGGCWRRPNTRIATDLPDPLNSLDAAMGLVPEGLRLMLSEWDDEKHLRAKGAWQAILTKPDSGSSFTSMYGYRCEHAATPALALTAAALLARAAQMEEEA